MPDNLDPLTSAFNQEHWTPDMAKVYYKENVARAIVNEELRASLPDGTRVHKPYRGGLKDQAYAKGVDISVTNVLAGYDEYMDVEAPRVVPFYLDDLDKKQNKWDLIPLYAKDAQQMLNNRIDQRIFSEYSNAAKFVSAQDLGGSGTGAATLSTANIANVFATGARNLDKYNRGQAERFAILGPRLREILRLSLAGRETGFGDTVGDNGIIGKRFGFDLYFSNNIPFTATLTSSSIPVAAETVTVDGVVFTWAASGAANAAGKVSIGANEAAAYANLVLAINGTGTPGVGTYGEISADDRDSLYAGAITASFDTHTTTISGYGDVVISEATTDLAVTTNVQYPILGVKKGIDFVALQEPRVEFRQAEKRLGRYVYPWTRYAAKTFLKEKKSLTYVKVNAINWV